MAKFKEVLEIVKSLLGLPGLIVSVVAVLAPAAKYIFSISIPVTIDLFLLVPAIVVGVLGVVYIAIFALPNLRLKALTANADNIWENVKGSIREFHASEDHKIRFRAEKKYLKNRRTLQKLCVAHRTKIMNSLAEKVPNAKNFAGPVVGNFEVTFMSSSLSTWAKHCKRNLQDELDTFDDIPLIMQSRR